MSAPDYTEMGCFFSLFMQKKRIFGAERSILSAFQLFLRTIYRLKLLQALRRRAIFGVSYVCPKNYDFSESCYENLTSRTSTISLPSAQSATDCLSELLE